MAEAKGLKEVVKTVAIAGAFVGRRLKDGPGLDDLFAIPAWAVKNSGTIQEGIQGIDKVDDEIKAMTKDAAMRADFAEFMLAEIVPIILAELRS